MPTRRDFGGVTLAGTGVTTFSSITTLATEFNVTDDDCKAGSPRFSVKVTTPSGSKTVFVYLGPLPNFTGCTPNTWLSSGNLISDLDLRFDISQRRGPPVLDVCAGSRGCRHATGGENLARRRLGLGFRRQGADGARPQHEGEQRHVLRFPAPPTTDGMNPAKACAALRTHMARTRSSSSTARTPTRRMPSASASRRWRG